MKYYLQETVQLSLCMYASLDPFPMSAKTSILYTDIQKELTCHQSSLLEYYTYFTISTISFYMLDAFLCWADFI